MKAKQFLMIAAILLADLAFAQQVDNRQPKRVQLSEAVAMANLVEVTAPRRPGDLGTHIVGKVLLKIVIDQDGKLAEAKVLSGHPMLGQASLESVIQWKFRPYRQNDVPVEVETTATIEFINDPPYVITPKPLSSPKGIKETAGVIDDPPPPPLVITPDVIPPDLSSSPKGI